MRDALSSVPWVKDVTVNFDRKQAILLAQRDQFDETALVRALEEALRERLATRVLVRIAKQGTGVIEVPFHGPEDFERIFALLAGREASDIVS